MLSDDDAGNVCHLISQDATAFVSDVFDVGKNCSVGNAVKAWHEISAEGRYVSSTCVSVVVIGRHWTPVAVDEILIGLLDCPEARLRKDFVGRLLDIWHFGKALLTR